MSTTPNGPEVDLVAAAIQAVDTHRCEQGDSPPYEAMARAAIEALAAMEPDA